MRAPDIVVKFNIKENEDEGVWRARCSTLPNIECSAESIPEVIEEIKKVLENEFSDASFVSGGVSSITVEYSIFRRKETGLEKFLVDSAKETAAVCEEATSLLKRVDAAVKEGKIESPAKDLHDVTIPLIASEPKAEPAQEETHV